MDMRMFQSALRLGGLFAVFALFAACGEEYKQRISFEGFYFKTKSSKVDDDRAVFTSTASGVSSSLDGARQAAEHEGIKYCINNFGSSDIVWALGPDTPPAQLVVSDNKLTFQGKCDP